MKKLVLVAALLTLGFVAAPAQAFDCFIFSNAAPFNGPVYNGCLEEMYSTCYQCVNISTGSGCASRGVCNPDGSGVMPPKYQYVNVGPQPGKALPQPRTARRSAFTAPARVAKLDTRKLF